MFQAAMSTPNLSKEASLSTSCFNSSLLQNNTPPQEQPPPPKKLKKKRNLPGNPDPDSEVIALSPKSLLATNRFICEICNKGFQRDQNLQLHRRGHNLPWKLKQRSNKDVVKKKVYVCPEPSCVHHHPSRALGDLTGIKKHFCRKHGEKKFKCDKCSKIYAVQSDWKAHSKTCGTREYRCDCGTLFSRKDSFITHRAFCDALAEESARYSSNPFTNKPTTHGLHPHPPFPNLSTPSQNPNSHLFPFPSSTPSSISLTPPPWTQQNPNNNNNNNNPLIQIKAENNPLFSSPPPSFFPKGLSSTTPTTSPFTPALSTTPTPSTQFLSATSLLQKAAAMGSVVASTTSPNTLPPSHHQQQTTLLDEVVMGPSVVMAPASHDQHQNHQSQAQRDDYNTILGLASLARWQKNNEGFTRDFLGLNPGDYDYHENTCTGGGGGGGGDGNSAGEDEMLKFTGGLQYGVTTGSYDVDNSALLKPQQHQFHQEVDGFGGFIANNADQPHVAAPEFKWG